MITAFLIGENGSKVFRTGWKCEITNHKIWVLPSDDKVWDGKSPVRIVFISYTSWPLMVAFSSTIDSGIFLIFHCTLAEQDSMKTNDNNFILGQTI